MSALTGARRVVVRLALAGVVMAQLTASAVWPDPWLGEAPTATERHLIDGWMAELGVADLDVTVRIDRDPRPRYAGAYVGAADRILLMPAAGGLDGPWVLAHELGHALQARAGTVGRAGSERGADCVADVLTAAARTDCTPTELLEAGAIVGAGRAGHPLRIPGGVVRTPGDGYAGRADHGGGIPDPTTLSALYRARLLAGVAAPGDPMPIRWDHGDTVIGWWVEG